MSDNPLNLTRAQLAEFLPNQRAIRAFEQMLAQTNTFLPDQITAINSKLDVVSGAPPEQVDSQQSVDYIDMNQNAPHAAKPGRLVWNKDDDTLNMHHSNGVIQQVGVEAYSRITNVSGAPILNGKTVSLANVGLGGPVGGQYYIADGTIPSLYIIGVATQDIAAGESGFVTVRGLIRDIDTTGTPYGEVWAEGDVLYASPTVAGALTNIKPSAPNIVLPMAIVVSSDAVTGVIAARPTIFLQLYYGVFYSSVDQTAALINTAYAATFNTTAASFGVALGVPTSRIVVSQSGVFDFIFSVQVRKSSAAVGYIWVWLRKNGVDVANSALRVAVQGATGEAVISRSIPQFMAANDYVELMWAVDSTATSLDANAATAFAPATPSVTMTVAQINQ